VAGYRVRIKRSAKKELGALGLRDHKRLVARICTLEDDPRPQGCEKLSGEEKYRLRQGDFRIIYAIDDEQSIVTVVKIGHRLRKD
jgi:mRNA interferase RelE/StbE